MMPQLTPFHNWWPSPWASSGDSAGEYKPDVLRAIVGQRDESRYLYASRPDLAQYISQYALSTWVYTAVARLAETAAAAAFHIGYEGNKTGYDKAHPLAALLGSSGRPNEYQSSFEFWENFFTDFELAGNAYWYWESKNGGAPDAVHLLPPASVRVIPGSTQAVAAYEYIVSGNTYRLRPEQVLHFKRPNPFSRYYGLPALEALMTTVMGDVAMAKWNKDFFGDGVSIPAGILILPSAVGDDERNRFDREFNAKHGQQRRTAILRADAGSTVYHPAGLSQQEADFKGGRLLTRQEVYEALDLPLGYMSEASTEAHARVAERRFLWSVRRRHQRIETKINAFALSFWRGWRTRVARFEDVRKEAADWDQLSKRIKASAPYMTTDEVRENILGLEPLGGANGRLRNNSAPDDGGTQDRGDGGSVPPEGQV